MRFCVIALVLLLVFVSPAFAAGNLTVNSTNLTPSFINTRILTNMLNLSLNATGGNVTINNITVTIGGTAGIGNVSLVALKNSTGFMIASSSSNYSSTTFNVAITDGFNVTTTSNNSLIIALNISSSATRLATVAVNISSSASFAVDTGSNVSLASGFKNSSASQIQDVHANVSITPRIVDTSVINQTFIYTFTTTGSDTIQNYTINMPSGYPVINLTIVEKGGSNLTPTEHYSNVTTQNQINISLVSPTTQNLRLFFTVNTSSTNITSTAFTSKITGSNLTNVDTDAVDGNQTNVTTKLLANITSVGAMKTTVILNGTDYWEFNFTVNITDAVSGLLQFKMANWSNSASAETIALTGVNISYATLRNESNFNTTSIFNVTNNYNFTQGLLYSTSGPTTLMVFLRMVVPSTVTTITSTWFTTYSMLFRAS